MRYFFYFFFDRAVELVDGSLAGFLPVLLCMESDDLFLFRSSIEYVRQHVFFRRPGLATSAS